MPSISRRHVISAAIVALTLGAAAACGSSSSGGNNSSVTPKTGVNSAAAALVPSAVKAKGTLLVASDAEYAPNEFIGSDGTTVEGMDVDLIKALAAAMGLKVHVINVTFNAIIPGMTNGRYALGISSFTDTKEREKQVNFVTYFSAGTSFFTKVNGGPTINTIADLCGHSVAVESGTTQQADATAQSKKCTNGKVSVDAYPDQAKANLALANGRDEVSMADSPVAAYAVKQSHGQFKLSGQTYGSAPYGIAVPKQEGSLDRAILIALKGLMANGTYRQILDKWGVGAGAITNPTINGAIS